MSGFFDLVKSGKLKSPTQKGFCLNKWNRSWSELSASATSRDNKIYNAGIVFHGLLDEIRVDLEKMYKERLPKVNNDQLIVAYMALSNRERFKLSEKIGSMNKNLQSSTISNNILNNEITFFEGADGAVDAFEKALFLCKKGSEDAIVLKQGLESVDLEEFILKISYLSQNYGAYEKYWQSIFWCDFDFMEIDVDNKVFLIKQPQSDLEIGGLVSQTRKYKLQSNSALMGVTPIVQRFFDKQTYVSFVKDGRKKRLVCRPIKAADEWLRSINAGFSADILFLNESFSVGFTNFNLKKGFSIKEALEVLKRLTLLSEVFSRSYPKSNSTLSLDSLSGFCPKVDKTELCIALSKSTEFSFSKVKKILEFLEYNTQEKKDLWCHPIVSVFDSKYALLTSALATPVILRVVEHWLVELEVDLQDKGADYEKMIIKDLNDVISKNKKITDFDEATSRRLRIKENEDEEEIDLMLRIGDVILIGEAKSIVTTDSPISNYRCLETLRYASIQVKRKTDFFKRNLPEIFKRLGWKYDTNKEYSFVGCILNSGRMYVGSTIDGVPVCDETILKKYFSSDKIPLFSAYCEKIKDHRHFSWFKIYDTFEEMQNNLGRYLKSPPQVCINPAFFEYKEAVVPFLSESSYKIVFSRMVYKNLSLSEISDLSSIGREFPIEKIDSYQEEVDKIDYIF